MLTSLCLLLLILLHSVSRGTTNVFTSSVKMVELAATEKAVLHAVTSSHGNHGVLKEFVATRREAGRETGRDSGGHPNAAYLLIKAFLRFWLNQRTASPEVASVLSSDKVVLPTEADLSGSRSAILRLQRVYNLSVADIMAGSYHGYQGPPLSPLDAFEIGKQAFTDGLLDLSERWLRHSLTDVHKARNLNVPTPEPVVTSNQRSGFTVLQRASILALLGRVLVYKGQTEPARDLYQESAALAPDLGDVSQLATELHTMQGAQRVLENDDLSSKLSQLCTRAKNHTIDVRRPYHVCRYKPSLFLPYLRYQEEILSLQPYVSLFYRVIHHQEIERIINITKTKLARAAVEDDGQSNRRTSDLGWIHDGQDVTAARLSARISDVTWLDVTDRQPEGPSSGEPFQVVNYGLGGHYSAHYDILRNPGIHYLMKSGVRIATFLLYLSDVDIGGHTVFVDAGVSVAPVKGMALFWYNTNTALEQEPLTLHAGCPVLRGHKWIANKWIWTYGNMYRRPCGRTPSSTQREVERITFSRRRHIPL